MVVGKVLPFDPLKTQSHTTNPATSSFPLGTSLTASDLVNATYLIYDFDFSPTCGFSSICSQTYYHLNK